jgi:hypothetical protein
MNLCFWVFEPITILENSSHFELLFLLLLLVSYFFDEEDISCFRVILQSCG